MKFQVTIGGHTLRIDRTADGASVVEGQIRAVDAVLVAPDVWSVIVDARSHEVALLGRGPLRVQVDGVEARAEVLDERELRALPTAGRARAARHEVRAPMPGLLKRVHVREGEVVAQGAALVTLEAMKMENELRAPRAGTVAEVRVREGQSVEANAVLVVLE